MRDAFGEIDPDEIDIIGADPLVFGPLPRSTAATGDRAASLAPRRRRWVRPAAIGGIVALSVAAVAGALLVWQPWESHGGIRVSFPTGNTTTAEMTDELVFAEPPADLSAAALGEVAPGQGGGLNSLRSGEGYLFAEPGATFGTGRGGAGRWATFFAFPAESPDVRTVGDGTGSGPNTVTVQGAPGLLTTSIGSRTTQIDFGPLGGYMYTVATFELSRADSLAFAESVSLDHGTPVVNDSTVLGDMRPLGSIADFATVFGMVVAIGEPGFPQAGIVSAQYGSGDHQYSVTSHPTTTSAMTMVSFFLGAGQTVTVHGQPGLAFEIDAVDPLLAFGSGSGTVIAWVEGGRLVIVTGPDGVVATSALAKSVRTATDAEWADVARAAATTVDPTSQVIAP